MSGISRQSKEFVFTGWHMLAILVAFFGVVVSVNLLMAYYASSSWSGILAKNTYVASQEFNIKAEEARDWARLGYKGELSVSRDVIDYRLEGPEDVVSALGEIKAIFHRPVGEQQDFTISLQRSSAGHFTATHALGRGQWIVDLAAIKDAKVVYHQARRITISE